MIRANYTQNPQKRGKIDAYRMDNQQSFEFKVATKVSLICNTLNYSCTDRDNNNLFGKTKAHPIYEKTDLSKVNPLL